jgi:Uma2 family endonuclease
MTTQTGITIDLNREYSLEEYAALPDDGNHYELIEGKLIMTPAPRDRHGRICDELLTELKIFLRNHPGTGEVWSHTGFNLGKKPNGKDNVPEPDLGFITASRVPPESNDYLPYPDLAVEVWSSDSDLGSPSKLRKAREKLLMYLAAGTQIAWGINPENETVEVYYQGQSQAAKILKSRTNSMVKM